MISAHIFLITITILLSSCLFVVAYNYRKCLSDLQHGDFEIVLLHNNDIHGRFDQTDINGGRCTPHLAEANQCYGGFARIANVLRKYRSMAELPGGDPVIFLNAGDMYTGTVWFSIFKDQISSHLMNVLQPDAITIGNHEFDKGIKGLVPFLENIDAPFVVSNLDLSDTPELQSIKNLVKSTILTVNNIQIGIVGYLTPETIGTTSTGNVRITPEIDAINEETKNLKNQGVNIIIALGHSGYEMDKKIAYSCPDVDVVVGGHSHSFLWSGCSDYNFTEIIEGPYPDGVRLPNGKLVPVVQASAFTKYLGYMKLKFNNSGNLIEWNGTPILLDATIPQDQDIVNLVNKYRPKIDAIGIEIGKTEIYLDGERSQCRNGECVVGNLVADSFLDCAAREFDHLETDQCISILNSGSIRSSISNKILNGSITLYDAMQTVPYNSSIARVQISGQKILDSLEKSASFYQTDNGGFLQFSGIKVTFNMTRPIGQRVASVSIRDDCSTGQYQQLNIEKKYLLVTLVYLLNGGDGYDLVDDDLKRTDLNCTDFTALVGYIEKHKLIRHQLEGRQAQV